YPLLSDDTCWFLAVDFDKATWTDDSAAFLQACAARGIPAVLERSRSGQGGHVWVFLRFGPRSRVGSVRISSLRRWSVIRISAFRLTTGSSRVRTVCRQAVSAT